VAAAFSGTGNRVMTSPDGITWTARTSAADNEWISVTWGGPAGQEKFVAVAASGSGNRVMTSPDGITWTSQISPADNGWGSVVWDGPEGEEQFVAVSNSGTAQRVMTSPDGVEWTLRDTPSGTGWRWVTWGGPEGDEKFVAVADSGTGDRAMTSGLDCVDIDGAADEEYTLTGDDEGARIRVVVTGTNDAGSTTAFSDLTAPIDPEPVSPPENTDAPTVSGSIGVGAVLAADDGTWTGNPTPTYTYQWQRCDETGVYCTDISGADDPTYTQTRDDVGFRIRVKVTGSNSEGESSAFSDPTETVTAPPANTTPPSISGDPKVGETLTADPGEWSAYPDPEFSYQWQRCDADGNNCVDIDGATDNEYTATDADTGKKLRVKVTASNEEGESTASSSQTALVEGPPVNTAPPVASGSARVGQTLTTTNGVWAAQPAATYTYQWLRCDANGENCVDIPGANSATYRPTSADQGSTIRAQVIATNSEGSEGAISNAIGPIQAAPPSGKPKIKVSVKAPKKVKAGKRFTIRVKTTNRARKQTTKSTRSTQSSTPPTTATRVKTCITLPKGVFVINPRGGKVSGRKVCWTKKSLAAGRSVSYSVVVRASSTASGSERISASASASNSSGATAKAKAKSRVKVIKPKPKPKPKPPTG